MSSLKLVRLMHLSRHAANVAYNFTPGNAVSRLKCTIHLETHTLCPFSFEPQFQLLRPSKDTVLRLSRRLRI